MITLDLHGKIYIVWNYSETTTWSEHDIFDASPDGLSGTKEGFYFANWLMPLRVPFQLMGTTISPQIYPECLDQDKYPCETCCFFKVENCPLLLDKVNFSLSRLGFKSYKVFVYSPRGDREGIFDAAQKELISHGKPLHYQFLTKILKSRYPALKITDRKVHKILKLNPVFFQLLDDGVYQAVPGITKTNYFDFLFQEDLFF